MPEIQRVDAIEKRIVKVEALWNTPHERVLRDLRMKKIFGFSMFRVPVRIAIY